MPNLKQAGPAEYLTLFINEKGQLYSSAIGTPQVKPGNTGSVQVANVPAGLTFTYCQGGGHTGLATDSKGIVWALGDSSAGVLGTGAAAGSAAPAPITGVSGIIQAQLGFNWVVGVKSDGTLWAWGKLPPHFCPGADGSALLKPTQIPIPGNRTVTKVQAYIMVEVLCSDGTVWTWGGNNTAILGTNTNDTTQPQQVLLPELAIDIAGGNFWSYALGVSGELYGWGWYTNIMFGSFVGGPAQLPVAIKKYMGFPLPIASIYTSQVASYCLLSDGSLYAWGDNSVGELGNGEQADQVAAQWTSWPNLGASTLIVTIPQWIAPGIQFDAVFTGNGDVFGYFARDIAGMLYYAGRNKANVAGNGVMATDSVLGLQGDARPNSWNVPLLTRIDPFNAPIILCPSPYCLLPANANIAPCLGYTGGKSIPTASAGTAQVVSAPAVAAGTPTTAVAILTAAGSESAGGTIMKYLWVQLSGPNQAAINLASLPEPIVSGLVPGVYEFQVSVTDNNWNTATATVQVTCNQGVIIPPPPPKTITSLTIHFSDGTSLTLP
jgi:K319-like protein/regulator of chromosome condensation (RCC1) repeat-containing protein